MDDKVQKAFNSIVINRSEKENSGTYFQYMIMKAFNVYVQIALLFTTFASTMIQIFNSRSYSHLIYFTRRFSKRRFFKYSLA